MIALREAHDLLRAGFVLAGPVGHLDFDVVRIEEPAVSAQRPRPCARLPSP